MAEGTPTGDNGAMADDGRAASGAADEEEEASSESEERIEATMGPTPSYPFPADFSLEFQGSCINVIRHLCPQHPAGTRRVAIFFPGVHGGVGPCRQPGETFDPCALYATVASRLLAAPAACVDCYRCSWPYMRPRLAYAVGGAWRVLLHALLEAGKGSEPGAGAREISVVFVGHSLGGAVAMHAAEVVARRFGDDGSGGQELEGLEHTLVRVAGVCTLNGAMDIRQVPGSDPFASLAASRALLVCGDADEVVPPEATGQLYEALPMRDKRHMVLPGGTHDLFAHKARLVAELTAFVAHGLGADAAPLGDA